MAMVVSFFKLNIFFFVGFGFWLESIGAAALFGVALKSICLIVNILSAHLIY